MKHSTFKDFVREAYYAGIDHAGTVHWKGGTYVPNVWSHVQYALNAKHFDAAESMLVSSVDSIELHGVVTYWPTEEQAAKAYGEKTV